MILALVASVAVATTYAPQWYKDGKLPPPEDVARQVLACDVEGASACLNDLLQSEAIELPSDTKLSAAQIDCLATLSFETGYFVLAPEQYAQMLHRRSEEIAEPWNMELARQQLEAIGKLEGLPTRFSGESDVGFAARLEEHCGGVAKGALTKSLFGPHTFSPDWIGPGEATFMELGTALVCLASAGTVAGYEIGFVGNERLPE